MDKFYLCAKEGIYKVKPHEHKTQFDASGCTQKWAIELALENDKLKRRSETRWEMIQAMALTCHTLRTALKDLTHDIETDEGVSTEDWPLLDEAKKALDIKPYQAEKIVESWRQGHVLILAMQKVNHSLGNAQTVSQMALDAAKKEE